ncbi:hypothetical protein DJ013_09870 [Arcticibacterium luteifluviistationis]|uniref:Uncharacterized protein n=1 Tax=Arcticibacterium luteifluviistationis TaxID=1784714 RepID=A0A2Z4GBF9_9BACT|nr:hypothetical protein DJ013_09870 [Arcticibacterium luteifluviistationis]
MKAISCSFCLIAEQVQIGIFSCHLFRRKKTKLASLAKTITLKIKLTYFSLLIIRNEFKN